ncbi:tail fiber protein [uncultured Tenacibaculum sp.]|uniref:phage tail protein n=1 Tax=uncultured Tenacibaculum sp. TaxID=174713 RepID=UPI00262060E7|nr:tail fiber protein [uncultured Tenacibaculum sp.]
MNSTKKIIGLLFLSFILSNNSLQAQQEGFLGEVKMFAGNFVPRGWALCQGQLMSISQNQALFAVIGTIYGGDGRTTFALPDYRGRIPRGTGNGPGLQPAVIGQKGGVEFKTLSLLEMPIHNHNAVFTSAGATPTNISISIPAVADAGSTGDPENASLAIPELGSSEVNLYSTEQTDINLKPFTASALINASGTVTVGQTGGSQSFDNRQPFTTINYIICVSGVFPSRN